MITPSHIHHRVFSIYIYIDLSGRDILQSDLRVEESTEQRKPAANQKNQLTAWLSLRFGQVALGSQRNSFWK